MTNIQEKNWGRIEAAKDLAQFKKPIKECIDNIYKYEWDYDGEPFIITKSDVKDVLERYMNRHITEVDLELWADAIELRDDISFNKGDEDWIESVITTLASPEINGPITQETVHELLMNS